MLKPKPHFVLPAAIVLGALILAVAWFQHSAANRYYLVMGKDGVVTRIDRRTGELVSMKDGAQSLKENGREVAVSPRDLTERVSGVEVVFGLPDGFSYTEPLSAAIDASGWLVAHNPSSEWVEEIDFVFVSIRADFAWVSQPYTINASLAPSARAVCNFFYSLEDLTTIRGLGRGNLICKIVAREPPLKLDGAGGEVLAFTENKGGVFASEINVRLKPLSDTEVGVIVGLNPAHPVEPTRDDSYTFDLQLEDADGFNLGEIIVHEFEMTRMVDADGYLSRCEFETTISIPPEQYARISDVAIDYRSSPARKALYDQLRDKTAKDIARERRTAEEEGRIEEAEQQGKADEARQQRDAAWAQIKQGLTRERVEELLGQPERVLSLGAFTALYFERGASVNISKSGIVESYEKPFLR